MPVTGDSEPAYRNPVLAADWPDPDVVKVGDDYYLIASSFNRVPGLPVLHSRNLVDWELLGHALQENHPTTAFRLPRHGRGVWASAIRHHDGLFHITYPDPDFGVFVVSASDPAGPWSEPRLLLPGLGLIDPCPFWDEDGTAWLIHGWAASRSGTKNRLTLVPVDPGLTHPLGPGRTVVDADLIPGFGTLEGPKLYRRGKYYWIFAPAGGVPTGWQSVFRATDLAGPWEERTVLHQGDTDVNGPHQGAWVDGPDGREWFLHFQDAGAAGRIVHLEPLRWTEDDWPVIGAADPGQTCGTPVAEHPAPGPRPRPASRVPGSGPGFGPLWRWQANPQQDWSEGRPDRLRLRAVADDHGNLRSLPHVLGVPLPGIAATFETTVRLDPGRAGVRPGTRAGVVVLGRDYQWAGLRVDDSGNLEAVVARRRRDQYDEEVLQRAPVGDGPVRVRAEIDARQDVVLSVHPAGTGPVTGPAEPAAAGHWVGAELAVFAATPAGEPGDGAAEFTGARLAITEDVTEDVSGDQP
ncbi:glycoside hydrolase family 43 protein [Kineococcus sp. SYSU DK001]|uniref:glycoside hydrolase family 43 protein n=1 Tax=Kineococcus sp. SYSU DK001 TaxID=3383122 RepID=UPI003D7F161B